MNISIQDAISLHRCISQIEGESIVIGEEYDAFDEDVVVTYYKDENNDIIIKNVVINDIYSEKAKGLIQDYLDEVYYY